ncbi:ATP-binding protein [Pyrococcus kukulkanii]|uniref:ATP-binding protein n=1 Tax=Pyrococcus kukulkanii TaxID=1609559 RepID=UPI0035633299
MTDYEDFLDVLFSIDVESPAQSIKKALFLVLSADKEILGIPIPESVLTRVLREKKPKNAFAYITKLLGEVKDKGKAPVLILDELQVIRDLNVNGSVIYEPFNFFVHITKEAHLVNVFVVTSDSLFIEEVYNEAVLQERSDYLLVDDFDESTALEFLTSHGLEKRKAKLAVEYFGGKSSYLIEAIKHGDDLEEYCERMLGLRARQIYGFVYGKKRLINLLKNFTENEEIPFDGRVTKTLKQAVRANILFVNPLRGTIRPQGKLELLAIRRALRELKD